MLGRRLLMRRGGAATDPVFGNVSLLLQPTSGQADGVITDFSSNAFTMTKDGNTTTSNATTYFAGTKSIVYDGTTDRLWAPDNDAFYVPGDCTVEALVNFNSSAANRRIFQQVTGNLNNGHALYTDGSSRLNYALVSGGSVIVNLVGTTSMTTGTWYLLTLLISGNDFSVYVNTTSSEASAVSATHPANYTSEFYIGSQEDASSDMNGVIASFRFTKGVARAVTPLSSLTLWPTS